MAAMSPAARRAVCLDSASQGDKAMSICIDACAALNTIGVTTRSSVYELVVLRGDRGDVLVRGGRHFTKFRPALFLGSIADDGSVEPHTIGIGLRMNFVSGDRFVITSSVQSVSCRSADVAALECVSVQ
jgi:hypothetical protein